MGSKVPITEVNAALMRIKTAVSYGKYNFVNRQKNLSSMAAAGLLPDHVKQHILGLTYRQYLSGPEQETDSNFRPGDVYLFGLLIEGVEYYVKLKLVGQDGAEWCVCISFHPAERPLYYPY
jgi:hypothetical protein